jgi:hypothetical protein
LVEPPCPGPLPPVEAVEPVEVLPPVEAVEPVEVLPPLEGVEPVEVLPPAELPPFPFPPGMPPGSVTSLPQENARTDNRDASPTR